MTFGASGRPCDNGRGGRQAELRAQASQPGQSETRGPAERAGVCYSVCSPFWSVRAPLPSAWIDRSAVNLAASIRPPCAALLVRARRVCDLR